MFDRPPDTYIGSLSKYRCDRCARCKNSCDRILPVCSHCKVRGLECTLKRPLLKKSHTTKTKEQPKVSMKGFVFVNGKNFKPDTTDDDKSDTDQVVKIVYPTTRALAQLESDRNEVNGIKRKPFFFNLYALFNCPPTDKPNSGFFLYFNTLKKFNLFHPKQVTYPVKCNLYDKYEDNRSVMSHFFNLYFRYVNPTMPLFNKATFFNTNRSKFLVSAILLRGYFIAENKFKDAGLRDYLESQLYEQFKVHRNKFSVDTVQALVIMFSGFETNWITFASNTILGLAARISVAIGLNKKAYASKNCTMLNMVERVMAYAAVQQFIVRDNWIYPPIISLLKDAPLEYDFSCQFYNSNDQSNFHGLIVAEFFTLVPDLAYSLATMRGLIVENKITEQTVNQQISYFIDSLNSIKLNLLTKLYKSSLPPTDINNFTTNFINFHYVLLKFRIYSLLIHFEKYNSPSSSTSSVKTNTFINSSIEAAAEVIDFGSKIILDTPPRSVIPCITQAFVFLLRYKVYYPKPILVDQLVKNSFSHFHYLIENTLDPFLAKLNLKVINSMDLVKDSK